jgi:DinB superfamily
MTTQDTSAPTDTHTCGCQDADSQSSDPANTTCCQSQPAALTTDELADLPIDALITRFRRGVENFSPRIFAMPDDLLDYTFSPEIAAEHNTGLWSIRTLLGHVADAEVVYTHRFRRAVAEEGPVNPNWDEQAFLDSGIYTGPVEGHPATMTTAPSIAGFLAVTHTLRQWTAEWLQSLSADQWNRKLIHPWLGPMTLKSIVASQVWHLESHARFLNNKVSQLLGPDESAQTAGCCQNQPKAESSSESSADPDNPANHTGCCNGSNG